MGNCENEYLFHGILKNANLLPTRASDHTNLNISKYIFGEPMVLVLYTNSNLTHKYVTNFIIIKLHYKWEDWN